MSDILALPHGFEPRPMESKSIVLPLHQGSRSAYLQTQHSHIDHAVQRLIGERLWRWQALTNHACVAITFSALLTTERTAARLLPASVHRAILRCTRGWANWLRELESHQRSLAYEARLNTHSPRLIPRVIILRTGTESGLGVPYHAHFAASIRRLCLC